MKVRAIEVGNREIWATYLYYLIKTSGPAQDWSQMGHFHCTMGFEGIRSILWLGGSNNSQLMMVIPWLGSQSLLKPSSMPGAGFSNSQEFPEADGMAFVQNPRGLCCSSPTGACRDFPQYHFPPWIPLCHGIYTAPVSGPSVRCKPYYTALFCSGSNSKPIAH